MLCSGGVLAFSKHSLLKSQASLTCSKVSAFIEYWLCLPRLVRNSWTEKTAQKTNKQKRLGGHITNASAVPEVIAGLEYEFFLTGYISK